MVVCASALPQLHPLYMDHLCKPLHSHLVRMAYEGCTHHEEHAMEHLFALLPHEDQADLAAYYGLFGHQQCSLDDIAARHAEAPDEALARLNRSLRRLAVTPEWQMMASGQ